MNIFSGTPSLSLLDVLESNQSLELEQENVRLASGSIQIGRSDLGVALKSKIQRMAGGLHSPKRPRKSDWPACG